MKRNNIKASIVIAVILSIPLLFYLLIGVEQYNYLYPHIDTRFSNNFDIEKFEEIQVGMTKNEVEKKIGLPLQLRRNEFGYTDDIVKENVKYISEYSADGAYKYADYAWECFKIYYDIDFKVVAKRRIWLND